MTWETNWLRYLAQQSASSESTTIAPSSPDAEPGIRPEGESGPFGGNTFMFIMIGAMAIFMWLFVLRPQRKEEKRKKEMLSQLKKGDPILTTSGMLGTVASVKEETIVINVGDGTRIEMLRSAVSGVRSSSKDKTGEAKK